MNKLLLTATALGILALAPTLTVAPAFAACNPGTPNCIRISPALAKVKGQLLDPGTLGSGDIDCQGTKLCGIDTGDGTSPGALRTTSPTTPSSVPVQKAGSVQVR